MSDWPTISRTGLRGPICWRRPVRWKKQLVRTNERLASNATRLFANSCSSEPLASAQVKEAAASAREHLLLREDGGQRHRQHIGVVAAEMQAAAFMPCLRRLHDQVGHGDQVAQFQQVARHVEVGVELVDLF